MSAINIDQCRAIVFNTLNLIKEAIDDEASHLSPVRAAALAQVFMTHLTADVQIDAAARMECFSQAVNYVLYERSIQGWDEERSDENEWLDETRFGDEAIEDDIVFRRLSLDILDSCAQFEQAVASGPKHTDFLNYGAPKPQVSKGRRRQFG